jgi:hypothetical protein
MFVHVVKVDKMFLGNAVGYTHESQEGERGRMEERERFAC